MGAAVFVWRIHVNGVKAQPKLEEFAAATGFKILSQKPLFFYVPPIRFWLQLDRYPSYYALLVTDQKGMNYRLIVAMSHAIVLFGQPKKPLLLESASFNPRLERF